MQRVQRPTRGPIKKIVLSLQRIDVGKEHSNQERCEQQTEGEYALRHAVLNGRSAGAGSHGEITGSSRRVNGANLTEERRARTAPDGFDRVTPNRTENESLRIMGRKKWRGKATEVLVA